MPCEEGHLVTIRTGRCHVCDKQVHEPSDPECEMHLPGWRYEKDEMERCTLCRWGV